MNIAIVGSGISGLTCAYLLSRHHDISVFEDGVVSALRVAQAFGQTL